jgi:hypothetical protein
MRNNVSIPPTGKLFRSAIQDVAVELEYTARARVAIKVRQKNRGGGPNAEAADLARRTRSAKKLKKFFTPGVSGGRLMQQPMVDMVCAEQPQARFQALARGVEIEAGLQVSPALRRPCHSAFYAPDSAMDGWKRIQHTSRARPQIPSGCPDRRAQPEFRDNRDLVALAAQKLSKNSFRLSIAIHARHVEVPDALFKRMVEHRSGLSGTVYLQRGATKAKRSLQLRVCRSRIARLRRGCAWSFNYWVQAEVCTDRSLLQTRSFIRSPG